MATEAATETTQTTTTEGGGASDPKDLANIVNSAVSAQLKRILKTHTLTPKAQAAEPADEPEAETETRAKPKDGADDVQRQLDDLKKALRKSEDGRKADRRASFEERATSDLRAALKGKVRPEAVETVTKLLAKAEGRLKVDDKGAVQFLHDGEEHDLEAGVEAWLATADALMFKPAPGYGTTAAKKTGTKVSGRTTTQAAPPNETPLQKAKRLLGNLQNDSGGSKIL